jgi:hypothetical protein
MKRYLVIPVLAIGLAFLLVPQQAHATSFGFYNITNNVPSDVDVAEQLFVDVLDPGTPDQVLFWFRNEGPTTSFIDEVYFDDGTLLKLAGIIDADDTALASPPAPNVGHSGVDFTQDALDPVKPKDLPGGESISPKFDVTALFSADSDSPGTGKDGVDQTEWLGIVFDLYSGKTYTDVINDLNSGALRIGLHVQGIGTDGKSDSFVNSIPDPVAVLLLGSACLIGFAGARRKFKK